MKIIFPSLLAILIVFSTMFVSCSPRLSPITQQVIEENGWNESQLKKIQFFLSDQIVLRRASGKSKSNIKDGKIILESDDNIENIIIPKGTPGVVSYLPKDNRIAISFEENRKSRTLVFGPDSKQGKYYVLKVAKWVDNRGLISYANKDYYVLQSDAVAKLLVDFKSIKNQTVNSKVLGGNQVKK